MADLVKNATDVRLGLLGEELQQLLMKAIVPRNEAACHAFADACAHLAIVATHAGGLVQEALGAAVVAAGLEVTQLPKLEQLIDQIDAIAFDLADRRDEGKATAEEYSAAFRKARAVNALWYASQPDPVIAAVESAYEAVAALGDDDAPIVELARRHLSK